MSWIKPLVVVLAVVATSAAGYVLMARAPGSPWTIAAMFGPMAIVSLAWLWREGRRVATLASAVMLAMVVAALHAGRVRAETLYVLQHAGIHLALAAWFAASLRGEPLIVRVARRVHAMSPAMVAYATSVTRAWVLYFAVMAVTSVALFVRAPFATWSFFAAVFTPLSLAAMFVGEHALRYRLNPDFERVTMRAAVRAWREGPSQH